MAFGYFDFCKYKDKIYTLKLTVLECVQLKWFILVNCEDKVDLSFNNLMLKTVEKSCRDSNKTLPL